MGLELVCCTSTLLREIADKSCKQKDIAQTYALAIKSSEATDWRKVNEVIVERWSFAGLNRIKQLAWSGKAFHDAAKEEE